MKKAVILFICLVPLKVVSQVKQMKVAYTIAEHDAAPEGLAYDPVENVFYISSTYKRKIIKLRANGRASDFIKEQQDGIHGVVGMRVDAKRRILWAASGDVGKGMPIKNSDSLEWGYSGIYKYNLNNGKLLDKYLLHKPGEPSFMNDLTLDSKGTPYITDTRAQKIYTINPNENKLEVFMNLPQGYFPNGIDITPDNKYLFVAMYASPRNVYGRIEIETKKLDIVELNETWPAGADGLYFYKSTLLAIVPGEREERIIQYYLNEDLLKVVDMKILVENDPMLSQPSTGVIVGNKLYFVATSNLQFFARLYRESNGKINLNDLPPVRIGVIEVGGK